MAVKEMPMTEATATIAGQMRKAYFIHTILSSSFLVPVLLISIYKSKRKEMKD